MDNFNIQEILSLVKALVAFKSISPSDDSSIDFVSNYLLDLNLGFRIFKKDFINNSSALYAEVGFGEKNICFFGHLDVVEAGDLSLWKYDPFDVTIDGENIYGRGIVDMKGSIAVILYLFKNMKMDLENCKYSILLASDEETDGISTNAMLEYIYSKGHKIDFGIVGEPTSEKSIGDTLKVGRRGSINFDLVVNGVQGHVAYQEKAVNPNSKMIEILSVLKMIEWDLGSKYFDKSNLEITSIDCDNNSTNIIPSYCRARFNIRYNDICSGDELINKIKSTIENVYDNVVLEYKISAKPFLTKITDFHHSIAKSIEEKLLIKPIFSTSGGTSDARFVSKYCDLVETGFLNKTAHKINEHCRIEDFKEMCIIYIEALKNFAGVAKLVDVLDLGSSVARRGGSSPSIRI